MESQHFYRRLSAVRPWVALPPCVALALVSQTALADVVTDNAVFSTSNQSMWSTGPATNGSSEPASTTCICFNWNGDTYSPPFPLPVAAGLINFTASVSPGLAGLQLSQQDTNGAVNVAFPVNITYSAPDEALAGEQITLTTSGVPQTGGTLATLGPAQQAALSLVANINANIDVDYTSLISPDISDNVNISTGGQVTVPLVSIGSGATGITIPTPLPGFSFGAQVPNPLNLTSNDLVNGNQYTVSGSASPPFLSLNVQLVDVITAALNALGVPIPPLNGSTGIDSLGTSASYSILSDLIQLGPKFNQNFVFSETGLPVTITCSNGQSASGMLGQSFQFTMPANVPLACDAVADITNTFQNQTGFAIGGDQTYSVLSGALSIAGIDLFNFGPLLSSTQALPETSPVYLYDSTFPLAGFNSVEDRIVIDPIAEPSGTLPLLTGLLAMTLLYCPRQLRPQPRRPWTSRA